MISPSLNENAENLKKEVNKGKSALQKSQKENITPPEFKQAHFLRMHSVINKNKEFTRSKLVMPKMSITNIRLDL